MEQSPISLWYWQEIPSIGAAYIDWSGTGWVLEYFQQNVSFTRQLDVVERIQYNIL